MTGFVALPTKNPGDVLTSALWNTYLQGNADSGFMRMLADSTLIGSAASFDFTSIPATFAHLLLVVYARSDTAAVSDSVIARFNGDTGANYDYQTAAAVATAVTAQEVFAATGVTLAGGMPGGTAGANLFGVTDILIPHYANALNNKVAHCRSGWKAGTATTNVQKRDADGYWRSNAAINRVTLVCSSGGNFVAGSRATLYGMPA